MKMLNVFSSLIFLLILCSFSNVSAQPISKNNQNRVDRMMSQDNRHIENTDVVNEDPFKGLGKIKLSLTKEGESVADIIVNGNEAEFFVWPLWGAIVLGKAIGGVVGGGIYLAVDAIVGDDDDEITESRIEPSQINELSYDKVKLTVINKGIEEDHIIDMASLSTIVNTEGGCIRPFPLPKGWKTTKEQPSAVSVSIIPPALSSYIAQKTREILKD